ncbi:hypothetical protein [Candidatus Thioglobus sp.]|uniref:hypothetical protein n=1 Tax=Candidatus Thioglobus sp. TaxID=2026721 RepID=UPI001D744DDB|nr:hypothetical protein [Candidatus Thioglobus sp.]MBT3276497.1 hypothetical protein [Candidatus Thioglobus sp.]MBT3446446.1 hypothetical protein [Candidatus Thioglobus sp.]MBT4181750.1 hypothetical protein [Candidatus Thioglobus sp.]MBT4421605.1 hypothetical protein [Candidatus Thioglobus sp.]MBT4747641.1 hypothetical protein [Candidatus Thioglobus sp.]
MKKSALLLFVAIITIYSISKQDETVEKKSINVENCSIMEKTCQVQITNSASISFDITPKGMPPTKPAVANLQLNNLSAKAVELRFEGVDLDYQPPTVQLSKINSTTYSGEAFLSLCTLEKTKWVAHLTIHTSEKIWEISFPFIHSGDGYDIIAPSS